MAIDEQNIDYIAQEMAAIQKSVRDPNVLLPIVRELTRKLHRPDINKIEERFAQIMTER